MSRALRLPPELAAFIARPGPITMVLRGPPGTGKTTLTLAILEAFNGKKIYVTGRRSKGRLLDDFSWLGETSASGIEIVDSIVVPSASEVPAHDGGAAEPPGPPKSVPGRPSLDSLPPALRGAWGRSGAREPTPQDFSWMPAGLRSALALVGAADRAMIAVDSWDAFVDEYMDLTPKVVSDRIDRATLERTALRLVGRGSIHLLLVLERTDETQLDFLVDGIVATSRESYEGHQERWVSFPKLRGIRIETDSYPFTLEGGRFECITPAPLVHEVRRVTSEPDPSPVPGTLWPGARAFADAFGRPQVGDLTILESERAVPESAAQTLVFPMVATVLRGGGRVILGPSPAQKLTALWEAFRPTFSAESFREQVRVVSPGATLPAGHPLAKCLIAIPAAGRDELSRHGLPPTRKAREFLTEPTPKGMPGLAVFAAENLRAISRVSGAEYTADNLPIVIKSYMIGGPVHLVFTTGDDDPFLHGIRALAPIHLRLRNRRGRTFLYGLHPPTPGYVLTDRGLEDERPYDLLRSV